MFALKNILVLLAKHISCELRCPVTALITFLKGLHWSIATIMCKDTWKLKFYGHHFVWKWTRLSLTDSLISSEKGIPHFTYTVKICLATGPSDLKFITDTLPLFRFWTFLSEIQSVCGMRRWHATWNEWTHKIIQFYTPEKHFRLWNKTYHFWSSICLVFLQSKKFETCV